MCFSLNHQQECVSIHTQKHTSERAHTQFIHKVEMGAHILPMQIIHTGAEMHHHGHKRLQSPALSRSLVLMHIYCMIVFLVVFFLNYLDLQELLGLMASPS